MSERADHASESFENRGCQKLARSIQEHLEVHGGVTLEAEISCDNKRSKDELKHSMQAESEVCSVACWLSQPSRKSRQSAVAATSTWRRPSALQRL